MFTGERPITIPDENLVAGAFDGCGRIILFNLAEMHWDGK